MEPSMPKETPVAVMAAECGARRCIAEAALEAWLDCGPEGGYSLDAQRLAAMLPNIAAHVPNRSPGARAKELGLLFAGTGGRRKPMFMQMLRAHEDRVHFLYFWKAFGEAARMAEANLDAEGLTSELETLRDGLLRILEEPAHCQDSQGDPLPLDQRLVPTLALIGELHRTSAMSAQPRFWSGAAELLAGQLSVEELAVDYVTSVMFTWLREAALWEQDQRRTPAPLWTEWQQWLTPITAQTGRPVRLSIYDVSQSESVQKLNSIFAHRNAPLKLLGVFHAGVEVDGLEWSFGFACKQTGVVCSKPREHRQHHYRQTIELRATQIDPDKIASIISELIEEYPGEGYDLLRRNCCHFADDFCQRLGVGSIPGWIYRLARIGANVDTLLKNAACMRDRFYGVEPASKARLRHSVVRPVPQASPVVRHV